MTIFKSTIALLISAVLFGCVSTKEYNARLADIEGLRGNVSSLQEKLIQTEAEKATAQAEAAGLQKELDELKTQNKALKDDNANLDGLLKAKKDELSSKIAGLRDTVAQKDNEIASLKTQIAALNQEKDEAVKEKERSVAEMKKTYDSLMGEMNQEIKKGEITITQLKDKLSVNLVERILFDSGSAEIKKDGKKVLDRVAEILAKVTDKEIRVEGYTDNVPISPRLAARFPTNWELSTARATTVARYLQDKGIDPTILSAAGYSEFRPVAPNDDEEGRAKNRRIEISLVPKAKEEK
ncbi:MAG TPA: OmpA family protein [Nitrospirota bacterium]|nr:OmpA family protein [Nitrospirota bacterium]